MRRRSPAIRSRSRRCSRKAARTASQLARCGDRRRSRLPRRRATRRRLNSESLMTLSRRVLEEGQMRALYLAAVADGRALTDEQLSASMTATLAQKPKGAGWWVFAYGSLLWN